MELRQKNKKRGESVQTGNEGQASRAITDLAGLLLKDNALLRVVMNVKSFYHEFRRTNKKSSFASGLLFRGLSNFPKGIKMVI